MASSDVRLFVKPLPMDVVREDIEDVFGKFGSIEDVRVMRGYGFVEFKEPDDATSAFDGLNGTDFRGDRLIIEFAKARRPREENDRYRDRERFDRRDGRDSRDSRDGRDRRDFDSRDGGARSSRGQHRLVVSGLPEETSWQDLKDFTRTANVDVHYANVSRRRDGSGVVEFNSREDFDTVLEKLDGSDYKGGRVYFKEDLSRNDRYDDRRDRDYDRRGSDRRFRDRGDFRGGRRDYDRGDRRDYRPRDDRGYRDGGYRDDRRGDRRDRGDSYRDDRRGADDRRGSEPKRVGDVDEDRRANSRSRSPERRYSNGGAANYEGGADEDRERDRDDRDRDADRGREERGGSVDAEGDATW